MYHNICKIFVADHFLKGVLTALYLPIMGGEPLVVQGIISLSGIFFLKKFFENSFVFSVYFQTSSEKKFFEK